MSKEEIIKEYNSIVRVNSAKARDLIKKLNYKEDPVLLRCIAQTYLDESRFKDDGTPRKYINMRKWRLAEKYIIMAFAINPDCIEVLYTMGSVRKAYKQDDIAIYCFEKITKTD